MDEAARKKMAQAIVIGIGKPHEVKGDDDEKESDDSGPDEGLVAAMDEFLEGVEKKDSKRMAEAFESAHAIACAKSEERSGDSEDSDY